MRRNFFAVLLITSLCVIATPAQSEVVSADTKMSLVKTITGGISPKSVRSSGSGLVSAHNMMYKHSVTIYDANTFELIKTVSDSVQLSKFGYSKYSSIYKGAPVEGAYSPDGDYLYVTNYAMYGKGFNREGHDTCSPASPDNSMMYVTMNLSGKVASWDLVNNKAGKSVKTGKAARSLAISGDGTALFVVNFVSDTLSKVRTSDMKVIQNIKVCDEPIGVTYDSPTSRTWVACYGGSIKIFDNK